jgi:hypothetical protein
MLFDMAGNKATDPDFGTSGRIATNNVTKPSANAVAIVNPRTVRHPLRRTRVEALIELRQGGRYRSDVFHPIVTGRPRKCPCQLVMSEKIAAKTQTSTSNSDTAAMVTLVMCNITGIPGDAQTGQPR